MPGRCSLQHGNAGCPKPGLLKARYREALRGWCADLAQDLSGQVLFQLIAHTSALAPPRNGAAGGHARLEFQSTLQVAPTPSAPGTQQRPRTSALLALLLSMAGGGASPPSADITHSARRSNWATGTSKASRPSEIGEEEGEKNCGDRRAKN